MAIVNRSRVIQRRLTGRFGLLASIILFLLCVGMAYFFSSIPPAYHGTLFVQNHQTNQNQQNTVHDHHDVVLSSNSKFIYKPHNDLKLEPTSCSDILHKYRSGQIQQTNQASAAYPIDKSYVTRSNTEFSFQISVHAKEIDSIRHDIFETGDYYEDIMTNVIADIIGNPKNKHPIMLDVGANIGWFSLLAASHGAEVFAFEPNVINMVRFCESQILNGWSLVAENQESSNRIHSYLKGVGREHGSTLSMYTPDPNNPGSHTFIKDLAKDDLTKINGAGNLKKLDGGALPIVTLDALAKDQGWLAKNSSMKVVLMKMDIEGMEHIALSGSEELLKSNIIENILMEFNADSRKTIWVSLMSSLLDSGYMLYKVGDHRGPTEPYQSYSDNAEDVIEDIIRNDFGKGSNVNAWFKLKSELTLEQKSFFGT